MCGLASRVVPGAGSLLHCRQCVSNVVGLLPGASARQWTLSNDTPRTCELSLATPNWVSIRSSSLDLCSVRRGIPSGWAQPIRSALRVYTVTPFATAKGPQSGSPQVRCSPGVAVQWSQTQRRWGIVQRPNRGVWSGGGQECKSTSTNVASDDINPKIRRIGGHIETRGMISPFRA